MGDHSCPTNSKCMEWERGPFQGIISFDNIFYGMLVVFQSITLEGWSGIYYLVRGQRSRKKIEIHFFFLFFPTPLSFSPPLPLPLPFSIDIHPLSILPLSPSPSSLSPPSPLPPPLSLLLLPVCVFSGVYLYMGVLCLCHLPGLCLHSQPADWSTHHVS